MAGVHADGVHHPGHDLGVGVDVGGRDVAVGPDHDTDLARIAAGEVLELVSAELLRIDDHPSLGAAVRNSHHGAFPGHPHGKCLDLCQAHVRVVPNTTLGGTAVYVVMDPETAEHLDGVIVHQDREGDDQLTLALSKDSRHVWIEAQRLGGDVELLLGDLPRVRTSELRFCKPLAQRRLHLLSHVSSYPIAAGWLRAIGID